MQKYTFNQVFFNKYLEVLKCNFQEIPQLVMYRVFETPERQLVVSSLLFPGWSRETNNFLSVEEAAPASVPTTISPM